MRPRRSPGSLRLNHPQKRKHGYDGHACHAYGCGCFHTERRPSERPHGNACRNEPKRYLERIFHNNGKINHNTAKSIDPEVKIKGGGGGVLKIIIVEASNADEAKEQIVESAYRASDRLRDMAESGLAFTTLAFVDGSRGDAYNVYDRRIDRANLCDVDGGLLRDVVNNRLILLRVRRGFPVVG